MLSGVGGGSIADDILILEDFLSEADHYLSSGKEALLTLETIPTDADALDTLHRGFRTIMGVAGVISFDHIHAVSLQAERVLERAKDGRITLDGDALSLLHAARECLLQMVQGVQQAVDDGWQGSATRLNRNLPQDLIEGLRDVVSSAGKGTEEKRIGDILVEKGLTTPEALNDALEKQRDDPEQKLGEVLVKSGAVAKQDLLSALREQQGLGPSVGGGDEETMSLKRADFEELLEQIDKLVAAEAVVFENADISRMLSTAEEGGFGARLQELDDLVESIYRQGQKISGIPIAILFGVVSKFVRETAQEANKKVEIQFKGEDILCTRHVLQGLERPLKEMAHNCIAHAFKDSPTDRQSADKPANYQMKVTARDKGSSLLVEVEDDGGGIDCDQIRIAALEQELIDDPEKLSDDDALAFLLDDGFGAAPSEEGNEAAKPKGLIITQDGVASLKGSMHITSSGPEGTLITVRIPTDT